MFFQKRPKK